MKALRSGPPAVRRFVLSVAAWLCLLTPLSGELSAGNTPSPHAGTPYGPVQKLLLADQLARYGRDNYDPLALILAARMIKSVEFAAAQPLGQGKSTSAVPTQPPPPLDAGQLIDQALRWAGDRQDLRALIDEVKNTGARAVVGNIGLLGGSLAPGKSLVYRFSFEGGSDAAVAVLPTPSAGEEILDLDLQVSDANGRTICKGLERGLPTPCEWAPSHTGVFSVRIRNRGRTEVAFTLLVS